MKGRNLALTAGLVYLIALTAGAKYSKEGAFGHSPEGASFGSSQVDSCEALCVAFMIDNTLTASENAADFNQRSALLNVDFLDSQTVVGLDGVPLRGRWSVKGHSPSGLVTNTQEVSHTDAWIRDAVVTIGSKHTSAELLDKKNRASLAQELDQSVNRHLKNIGVETFSPSASELTFDDGMPED